VATPTYRSNYLEVLPGLAKLNHNEAARDAPEALKRAVIERLAAADWRRYPDPHAVVLRRKLSILFGHPDDGILVGNGANELIARVFIALHPESTLLLCPPAYYLYARVASTLGLRRLDVPLVPGPEGPFDLDAEGISSAAARVERPVLVLTNPGNPTGGLLDAKALERVLDAFPGLVVLDEAYHDYAQQTRLSDLMTHPNLLVLRTFSKAFALAGLRIGVLLAHPETMLELDKVAPPYALGLMPQIAAEVAFEFTGLVAESARETVVERERIAATLRALPGLEVFPSATNFLLLRAPADRVERVLAYLDAVRVVVRDLSKTPRLEGCFRISMGAPEDNDRAVVAIRAGLL